MILAKKLYKDISRPLSYLRLLKGTIIQYVSFSNDGDLSKANVGVGRPKLLKRSKVLIGNWKMCQEVCPTQCLEIEQKEGKVSKASLDLLNCIGCAQCVEVAPEKSFFLSSFDPITDLDNSIIDLLSELDHEDHKSEKSNA